MGFSTDPTDGNTTFLDDPIPEYVISRHKTLKKLHEAGLRFPPSYEDVDFSDSDSEQKPQLEKAIKPQRRKKNVKLASSGGTIPAPIAQWLRDYQVEALSSYMSGS
jgi:hypothetical protein